MRSTLVSVLMLMTPFAFPALGNQIYTSPNTTTPSCTSAHTLQDLIDFGSTGCIVGNFLFSHFAFVQNAGATPVASHIGVTVLASPGVAALIFIPDPATPFGPENPGAHIDYAVNEGPGTADINSATLYLNQTTTGDATSTDDERICINGQLQSNLKCSAGILENNTITNSDGPQTAAITPITRRIEVDTVMEQSSGTNGSSQLFGISEAFTDTTAAPEPSTAAFFVVGLPLVGLMFYRKGSGRKS